MLNMCYTQHLSLVRVNDFVNVFVWNRFRSHQLLGSFTSVQRCIRGCRSWDWFIWWGTDLERIWLHIVHLLSLTRGTQSNFYRGSRETLIPGVGTLLQLQWFRFRWTAVSHFAVSQRGLHWAVSPAPIVTVQQAFSLTLMPCWLDSWTAWWFEFNFRHKQCFCLQGHDHVSGIFVSVIVTSFEGFVCSRLLLKLIKKDFFSNVQDQQQLLGVAHKVLKRLLGQPPWT